VASTPLAKNLYGKLPRRAAELSGAILLLAGLILSVAYLVDGTYNPFLYFRF
jgi:alginate O-acetyltransferase complex protein AlgI